jgi:hypothetical protein
MCYRSRVLVAFAATLVLLVSPPVAGGDVAPDEPINRLIHGFVEAFNSGDFEVVTAFYEDAASSSFRDRRTEDEDRDLYTTLFDTLGKITIRTIEVQSNEVSMSAGMKIPGSTAEFRFQLVGDPGEIDGFSVGVNPHGEDSAGEPGGDHAMSPGGSGEGQPFDFLTSMKGVHQAQLLVQSDGTLLLVWVQKGPFDMDLYAARQGQEGKFSRPLRINRQGLNRYTGDEARPSVALGPDGLVAVAWTARNNDIMLAAGRQYGEVFDVPVKLNQDEGKAFRTMPSTAVSADGAAHAVWLDPREAPQGREEPSDLYYARVKDGVVEEKNLTGMQELTVCGCCRPYLAIEGDGSLDIAFRNATDGGYRDISSITGREGAFGEPRTTSPPIWKLGGCPMAGPIRSNGGTLWKDASTGSWRLLWSTDASEDPEVLLEDGDGLVLGHSPRFVGGRENWVLMAAEPHGLILEKDGSSWKVEREDLPPWVSSAVVHDGHLILIGSEKGSFRTEVRPI